MSEFRDISCYATAILIKFAKRKKMPESVYLQGIQEPLTHLNNVLEWTSIQTWTKLIDNIADYLGRKTGIFQDLGYEITVMEMTHFQMFFFKVAPMVFILKKISNHINTSINRNLRVSMTFSENGVMDIHYHILDLAKYNLILCDYNRGASLAIMHCKGYQDATITDMSCAARDSKISTCHYRITWKPRPSLFRRIRESFQLRFGYHGEILSFMEDKHRALEIQYEEILKLKNDIQASNDFLNHMMDNTNEGIVWLNGEGRIVFANAAFGRLVWKAEKELAWTTFWSHLSNAMTEFDYRRLFMESQEKTGIPQIKEFEFTRPSGDTRIGETIISWITTGQEEPGFLVTVRDITEKRKMERQLFASENRFRSLYQNSPALIVGIGSDSRFIYANPAMEEQSGYTETELQSMHFRDLVAPDANFDVDRLVMNRLDQGPSLQEVHFRTKAGEWKAIALNTYPIHDDTGALAGIAGIGIDITETKRLNEQLVQTQRMDLLGQMAGGLAHDFNNILLAISGYGRLLHKKEQNPELKEYASAIMSASERAAELTRQLLTFSRGEVGKQESFVLNSVVTEVKQLLMPIVPRIINIQMVLPEREIRVKGDSGKIHQCLLNLCLNARDAIGLIEGTITLRLVPGNEPDYIALEVEDSGPGIPPDIIEKIFDPFFSTKKRGKGTGLGLSVVYGIVRSHNGKITVDSKPGSGARFRIEFPEYQVEGQKGESMNEKNVPSDKKKGLVMIIDDEILVRGYCEDVLKSEHYSVISFPSAESAIEWFQIHSAEVRFAIADIILPEMDGVEMVEKLRAIRSDLAVFFMTGFISPNMKQPPESDPVLHKPFSPVAMMETIRKLEKERGL